MCGIQEAIMGDKKEELKKQIETLKNIRTDLGLNRKQFSEYMDIHQSLGLILSRLLVYKEKQGLIQRSQRLMAAGQMFLQ